MPSIPPAVNPGECDGHSVGVIVTGVGGLVLIGDRTDGAGAAPPAGHVYDAHPNPRTAARAEVTEETGLTVTRLTKVGGGWRANRCRRGDGPDGPGHAWRVYRATATGTLAPDPGSFTRMRWASQDELQALAARTVAYARARLTAADWRRRPGLELVWPLWLSRVGLLTVAHEDLVQIERVLEDDLAPHAT